MVLIHWYLIITSTLYQILNIADQVISAMIALRYCSSTMANLAPKEQSIQYEYVLSYAEKVKFHELRDLYRTLKQSYNNTKMRVNFSLQLFIRKQSLYAQMRKSNNSRGNVALQKRTNPRGSNFPSHEIQNSLILPFSKWKGKLTTYIDVYVYITSQSYLRLVLKFQTRVRATFIS